MIWCGRSPQPSTTCALLATRAQAVLFAAAACLNLNRDCCWDLDQLSGFVWSGRPVPFSFFVVFFLLIIFLIIIFHSLLLLLFILRSLILSLSPALPPPPPRSPSTSSSSSCSSLSCSLSFSCLFSVSSSSFPSFALSIFLALLFVCHSRKHGEGFFRAETLHKLHRTKLRRAKWRRAKLHRAKWRRAKLRRAKWHSAKLHRAKLHSAKMHRAKLPRAKLHGAKLHRAITYFHSPSPTTKKINIMLSWPSKRPSFTRAYIQLKHFAQMQRVGSPGFVDKVCIENWQFRAPEATFWRQSWKWPFVAKVCIQKTSF